jgi:transcriptional regulator GlxA family with amidase domain
VVKTPPTRSDAVSALSPLVWQLAMGIEHAKPRLSQTKVGIAAIAVTYDYIQPSHSAKLFRRATGLPPADGRRQHAS